MFPVLFRFDAKNETEKPRSSALLSDFDFCRFSHGVHISFSRLVRVRMYVSFFFFLRWARYIFL